MHLFWNICILPQWSKQKTNSGQNNGQRKVWICRHFADIKGTVSQNVHNQTVMDNSIPKERMIKQIIKLLWIRNDICHFIDLTLSGTALSQAGYCPGQRCVKQNTAKDSAKSSEILPRTALSQTKHCQEKRWVKLCTVALRQAKHCKGQRWVKRNTARDSAESS